MSLSKDSAKKLNNEFKSYKNFFTLFLDILKVNKFTFKKILISILFIIIVILFNYLSINKNGFKESFAIICDINFTLSIGLIGLLIGGFSIVLSSVNNETLYCLILYRDDSN